MVGYGAVVDFPYVRMHFAGHMQPGHIKSLLGQCSTCVQELRQRGVEAIVLLDISELKQITFSSRMHYARWIERADYDVMAIIGGNQFVRSMFNLFIRATDTSETIIPFITEAEALNWLKARSNAQTG